MASLGIPHQRLINQHLIGAPLETPERVVEWLSAVQSQDYPGAKWALGQRASGATSAHIDQLFNDGRILRTHVMRPTWHFVSPKDIRWLLALTAPRVHAANAYYYRKFGLADSLLKRSDDLLAKSLQGGRQLMRTEIASVLAESGIVASGLQLGYILMHAELNAVICSGAMNGKKHTYALLDDRAPNAKPLTRRAALTELATRYFASHGPARLQDFSWWSGLTTADAKAAVAGAKLTQHDQLYGTAPKPVPEKAAPAVHLLPNYDEYLIAYKDRSDYSTPFDVAPPATIFDRHILVVHGKVVGAWRETFKRHTMTVVVTPLIALGKTETKALGEAIERYGRFMETQVELTMTKLLGQ
jgi:hypothetical protein